MGVESHLVRIEVGGRARFLENAAHRFIRGNWRTLVLHHSRGEARDAKHMRECRGISYLPNGCSRRLVAKLVVRQEEGDQFLMHF